MKTLAATATGKLTNKSNTWNLMFKCFKGNELVIEVKIDYHRCINCKKCVESCTFGVLEWFEDQPIVTNPSNCSVCLECKSSCLVDAINIKAK